MCHFSSSGNTAYWQWWSSTRHSLLRLTDCKIRMSGRLSRLHSYLFDMKFSTAGYVQTYMSFTRCDLCMMISRMLCGIRPLTSFFFTLFESSVLHLGAYSYSYENYPITLIYPLVLRALKFDDVFGQRYIVRATIVI